MKIFLWRRLKLNFSYVFSSLSLFQKIELYLIPPLLAFFLFSSDLFLNSQPLENIKLKIQKNTPKQANKIEVVAFYETIAKIENVKINALKIEKNHTVFVKFTGEIDNLLNFIGQIEKRAPIDSLDFIQLDDKIAIDGIFSIKNFHNTTITPLPKITIQNPFETTITLSNKIQQPTLLAKQPIKKSIKPKIKKEPLEKIPKISPPLQLPIEEKLAEEETIDRTIDMVEVLPKTKTVAIVGEYVLLNKEWLKVGDSYKGYTIKEISKETIEFAKDGGKLAVMEMFDDN